MLKLSLSIFKLFTLKAAPPLFLARPYQSLMGKVLKAPYYKRLDSENIAIGGIRAKMLTPKNQTQGGVILYLHGGGYSYGDLSYSLGFASELSFRLGIKVMPIEYRLAPENPFPCALEDCVIAYKYLLDSGYDPKEIFIFGESAGGGLCYSLIFKLRELGLKMPCGVISLSAWADLTLSSKSMTENKKRDPSLTKHGLAYFTKNYTGAKNIRDIDSGKVKDPLISPVFGNFDSFPPCFLIAGGDEILLDDTRTLYQKVKECGSYAKMKITPNMWHCYLVYGLKEYRCDFKEIQDFITEARALAKGENYEN